MNHLKGKGFRFAITIVCILVASCNKKDIYDPLKGKGSATDLFNFATTSNTKLDVDYGVKGYKVNFEVYIEDPVSVIEDNIVKKEGIEAIFKAYTDNDCHYSGVISLPTACSSVYIYTEAFGLPRIQEVEVSSEGINFNLKEYLLSRASAKSLSRAEESYTFDVPFDETQNPHNIKAIGYWDKTGKPTYLEDDADIPAGLLTRIQKTLPLGKNNSAYAKSTEITNTKVREKAKISLIFLSEWASFRNTLAYYYYPTGKILTQEEFNALPKFIALPNCSIPGCLGGDITNSPLQPGNQIKLKYYGEDYTSEASEIFPEGITIGWTLLAGGFEVSNDDKAPKIYPNGKWNNVYYSNQEFNKDNISRCVSLYDEKSQKVIVGFEDGTNNTYNDILFYLDATPEEAIHNPEIPVTKPEEYDPTTTTMKGTLAFEDSWPRRGDYDMNDVIIRYNSVIKKNQDNKVTKITDTFTPVNQGGIFLVSFGYQLGIPAEKVKSVTIKNGSSSAKVLNNMEANQEKATIMLFDDIHTITLGQDIIVTIEFDGTETEETILFPPYNPFICTGNFIPGNLRKETHLPGYMPTSLVNPSFFGSYDDYGYIEKSTGHYIHPYMTELAYPFAINVPVTNYKVPIEGQPIDNSYPKFKSWAESKGTSDPDWYLHPIE
ncbi:LruC domain-containing protein [Butyricimonas paravirosa]